MRDCGRLYGWKITGCRWRAGGGGEARAALTSRTTYLDPPLAAAAEASGIPLQKVSVNLINSVKVESSGKEIHYAVAAGVSPLEDGELGEDQIAINQWAADQLGAKVGDRLQFTFYRRGTSGNLANVGSDEAGFKRGFEVVKILPMSGMGA